MRMQKEEKTAVVLLLMAFGSLAVAFWAFNSDESAQGNATSNDINRRVSVEGLVTEINPTKSGGNLILKLDSTTLPVFVSANAGAKEIESRIGLGDRIQVNGLLREYNDEKEIVLERLEDLKK